MKWKQNWLHLKNSSLQKVNKCLDQTQAITETPHQPTIKAAIVKPRAEDLSPISQCETGVHRACVASIHPKDRMKGTVLPIRAWSSMTRKRNSQALSRTKKTLTTLMTKASTESGNMGSRSSKSHQIAISTNIHNNRSKKISHSCHPLRSLSLTSSSSPGAGSSSITARSSCRLIKCSIWKTEWPSHNWLIWWTQTNWTTSIRHCAQFRTPPNRSMRRLKLEWQNTKIGSHPLPNPKNHWILIGRLVVTIRKCDKVMSLQIVMPLELRINSSKVFKLKITRPLSRIVVASTINSNLNKLVPNVLEITFTDLAVI